MTVEELAHGLDHGQSPLIIDGGRCRGRTGALHLLTEQLKHYQSAIPRDRVIVLYCACPGDIGSATAAPVLRSTGFNDVRVLHGGLDAWRGVVRRRPNISKQTAAVSLETSGTRQFSL